MGPLVLTSDTDAISISSGGVVNISATTANTNASDGALTVAGGVGIALDASIGDDNLDLYQMMLFYLLVQIQKSL